MLISYSMAKQAFSVKTCQCLALLKVDCLLQTKTTAMETEIRKKVEDYREFYDGVVAEDKMLDRAFKRDFSDIPLSLSDQLYKLFRRRPRYEI